MLVRSTCLLAFLARQAAAIDVKPDLPVEKTKDGLYPNPNIIEGTQAGVGQYPYYVHMKIAKGFNTFSCGGSLIAPGVILSAAHCNDPYYDSNVENGYVGATRFWSTDNGAVLGECEEWRNHPEFIPVEFDPSGNILPGTTVLGGNDFALCLLKEPVYIDMSSVTLKMNEDPSFPPDTTDTVTESMGMGRTSGDRSNVTNVLLWADLNILPQQTCNSNMIFFDYIDETMICTLDNMDDPMSGVCSGDSGGPIIVSSVENGKTIHTQVGVVSFGAGNCGTYPDVQARVSAGMPWIKSTVCDDWGLRDSEFCDRDPFTCPNGQSVLTVTITTDDTPDQNMWTLLDSNGTVVASESLELANTEYYTTLCLQPGEYDFNLTDSGNDGMPDGSIVVILNNEEILNVTGTGSRIIAPDDLTNNPTAAPTPEPSSPSSPPTMAPTEFECETDQILTVAVETDFYAVESNWILEKYESDDWEVVASNDLNYDNTLFTNTYCLNVTVAYRFSIFDSYGDGLYSDQNCGFFEVTLNGNLIAEGTDFGYEDVTIFNTCVDQPGTFTVNHRRDQITKTCDELASILAGRNNPNRVGGKACRKNNLGVRGRVRYFCASTCGLYGEGECAAP